MLLRLSARLPARHAGSRGRRGQPARRTPALPPLPPPLSVRLPHPLAPAQRRSHRSCTHFDVPLPHRLPEFSQTGATRRGEGCQREGSAAVPPPPHARQTSRPRTHGAETRFLLPLPRCHTHLSAHDTARSGEGRDQRLCNKNTHVLRHRRVNGDNRRPRPGTDVRVYPRPGPGPGLPFRDRSLRTQ
jgi:hypothetical protein